MKFIRGFFISGLTQSLSAFNKLIKKYVLHNIPLKKIIMKKRCLLLTGLIFSSVIHFAQSTLSQKYPVTKIDFSPNTMRAHKQKTSSVSKVSTFNSGWFDYGAMTQGGDRTYSAAYLFPDSTASAYIMGTSYPIWAHHITEVVDFKSPVFGSAWTVTTSISDPLKIDSLGIAYLYSRSLTNITDTLIVTLFEDVVNGTSLFEEKYFLNTMGIPGNMDTIFYKQLGYDQSKNVIAASSNTSTIPFGQKVFKILLTQADTAVHGKEKMFVLPVPFISNGNKLIGVDFQFKPGYAYSLGQSINVTANAFQFISMEENGSNMNQGTYMYYWDYLSCHTPGNAYCDRGSSSHIITKDIRYNNAGTWNGHARPAITFNMQWPFEHHAIEFHLSDDMTNVCHASSQFSIFADPLNPGTYNSYNLSTGIGALSYLWDFGDGITSTQQYPSHQYAVPGQYPICLTVTATNNTLTCSNTYCDSSSVHRIASGFIMSQFNVIPQQITTNVKQNNDTFAFNVYPNPMNDELVIEIKNKESGLVYYELRDALGKMALSGIIEQNAYTLKTEELPKGFYTLNFISKQKAILKSTKLVK